MSTLVTNPQFTRHLKRTYRTYLLTAAFTYIFSYVYHYFGHGQSSTAMQTAFLYPLFVGVYYFAISKTNAYLKMAADIYRIGFNMLGSGVATLVVAQLIQGVFEIAGTSSALLAIFYILGTLMTAIGAIWCAVAMRPMERRKSVHLAKISTTQAQS